MEIYVVTSKSKGVVHSFVDYEDAEECANKNSDYMVEPCELKLTKKKPKYIRKNVTIPEELSIMAKDANLCYSELLRNAIINEIESK